MQLCITSQEIKSKMRSILLTIFFCSSSLWGLIQSDQILISPSAQGLQIVVPTKSKIQSKQNQSKTIQIILNEEMQGPVIKKSLPIPFISLEISPFNQQTLIVLQAQKDILLSQTQNLDQLKLFFQIYEEFQWWKYGAVIALLLALIVLLLYLKKKQNRHSPDYFKIKQQYFNKDCIITTLESKEASYLIFSNQKGCILLEKQSHTKEN